MIPMNIINIYENYNAYFNADLKAIFEQCSKIASQKGYKLYLIGGMVRDLLLNQKSLDIDITVEGNAIDFARELEKAGAKILSVHESFGTVKVEIQGQKIDFASTRSERYPKKGHLPHVEKIGCSLKEDVLRRDFSVNSLAMSLNQESFGDLIDYAGGFEDLKAKKIRILHDKSFIDDPTRIIRALKYSQRLGFELDEKTLKLQQEYLENINYDMCYKRVKQELKKTFDFASQKTFDKFIEQGIYKLINENSIKKYPKNIEKLINIYRPKHPWLVYLGSILSSNADKLQPTKYEKEVLDNVKALINANFSNNFEIHKAFCSQKLETLLILAVSGKEKEVLHYLDNLQKIKLSITGKDLIKLGLKPSKQFNEVFDKVLIEKLKEPTMSKEEEIAIVTRFCRQ